jgi:hypothetical protein
MHSKSLIKSDTSKENTHIMDRRTVMKRAGAFSAAAAVAGAAGTAITSPASAAPRGKSITLDVDTDGFADFQQVESGEVDDGFGPFYVSGDILAPGTSTTIGTDGIGTFHCWGWIRSPDGLAVVNQEFDIDGRGQILISGVESDAPRAVSGGTHDFRNARGEGIPDVAIFDFDNSGQFRIAFGLTGARGRPIT